MNTSEKNEKLRNFKNEKEFREFLIDFLKKRGFLDVFHTHRYGSPELGKDIIARYPHGLDEFEWYSFVVKKGRIGGGTTEVEEIKGQIKQSFEYPYKGIDGNRLKINKVKVVTNENFTGGAQETISQSPELKIYNNFGFWWNETLIPEIDKYYSDFWEPGDAFSKEYSKAFTRKLKQEIEIRELSIQKIDDKKLQKLIDIFIEPKLSISYIEEDKATKEKSVKRKNINISSLSELTENLVLSGEQGSGKTKILNKIACQICTPENISKNKSIPVRIKAPLLRSNNFDIEKTIIDEIKELLDNFYDESILKDYKITLYVDDLDLLASNEKELVVKNIKMYCEQNQTFYIISYRKNEFSFDSEINSIKIHNFNNRQIEAFITKFFEGTDRGNKFIQILKESDILSKLPTTPLTITLISLLYDENNYEIPATLSDIYTDFTNVLLGKLNVKNKTDLLLLGIKKRLFTTLALEMLDKKIFEISFTEFENHINGFLKERGYELQTNSELLEIIEDSGLLFLNDEKQVGFKQQAFIEFLASLEIYHNKRETHYSKLIKNFNDINWQNVAIFYAGHAKELVNMIDDVVTNAPNKNLKDFFINSGGMGYLAQALYQTSPKERSKLVRKSIEILVKSFYLLKNESREESNQLHNIPLPVLATIINFWFNENFKSITLTATLIETFEDIYNNGNTDFDTNLGLLMIATTLMNPYIDSDGCMTKLVDRSEFMNNAVLTLVADMTLELGKINKHNVSKELKNEIIKSIKKKREVIKLILKEPAYRFNDNLLLEKETQPPTRAKKS